MVVVREVTPYDKLKIAQYVESKKAELERLRPKSTAPLPTAWTDDDHTNFRRYVGGGNTSESISKLFRETAQHFREAEVIGHQIESLNRAVQNLGSCRGPQRVGGGNVFEKYVAYADELDSEARKMEIHEAGDGRRRQNTPVSLECEEDFVFHGRNESHLVYMRASESVKSVSKTSLTSSKSSTSVSSGSGRKKRIPECPPHVQEMLRRAKERRNETPKLPVRVSVLDLKLQ